MREGNIRKINIRRKGVVRKVKEVRLKMDGKRRVKIVSDDITLTSKSDLTAYILKIDVV